MKAALFAGHLIWGYELDTLVVGGLVPDEDVIQLYKLAFYENNSEDTLRQVKRVNEQLALLGLTVDNFLAIQPKVAIKSCLDEIITSDDPLDVGWRRRSEEHRASHPHLRSTDVDS